MIAAAQRSASATGSTSISRTKASAANRHIDPCAKLNTADALKISTKPSATSAYNTPVKRPPIKTSRTIKSIAPLRPSRQERELWDAPAWRRDPPHPDALPPQAGGEGD